MSPRAKQQAVSASLILSALLMAAGLSGCGKNETPASLMSEAQQYETKGDNKAALIQLKNAAAKAPEDAEVRMRLASLYLKTGDAVSAEKEVRKASSLKVDAARTSPILVQSLVRQGQGKKAIEESDALATGANPDIQASRGDAFLSINEPAKAREAYQRAIAVAPNQPDALIGLARLAAINKDFDGAAKFIDQAAAANPKNADVFMFRGTLLRAQNKPDAAIAAFGQAITLRPDQVQGYLERANLYLSAKKLDLAKADIEAARKIAPNALPPLYSQALLEFTQNNYTAANDSIQKVLSKVPDHMPSVLLAGAIELNLGSFKLAEQHLSAYLNSNPDNVYARKLLAQTQLRSAQPASAGQTLAPLLKAGANDAQTLAMAGESSLRSQDFAKASQYFEQAAVLEPNQSNLRTSLGLSMLAQGKQDQGVEELEKATKLDPKSEQAGVALARSELALKHYDKALAAIKPVIAAHPDSADLRNLEGGIYMSKGDLPSARTSFDKAASMKTDMFGPVMNLAQIDVVEKKPEAAKARMVAFAEKNKGTAAPVALAALAMSQKNTAEATTWLEKAVADNPDDLNAAGQLVTHYMRTNQAPKALNLARKLQAANPAKPELLDALGQAQMATNDDAGALDTYSKLAGMLPKSAPAQLRLASVHLRLKNDAAAAEDLKRALALEPDNERAKLGQVEMALAAKKPDEALSLSRAMQKSAPKSALGYVIEGDILMLQKKFDAAARAYEQGHGIANNTSSLLKFAGALNAAGKGKEAEAKAAAWLAGHPGDGATTIYLGELALERKDYKLAAERFEAAQKIAPDQALVLNNLAWTYQLLKDPRAVATAERAVKAAPESATVIDTLGWILAEQGDTARALPLLQKAVKLQPGARDLRYHLAAALAKSGDKKGARQELDKVLADSTPFAQIDEAKALLKTL